MGMMLMVWVLRRTAPGRTVEEKGSLEGKSDKEVVLHVKIKRRHWLRP